jgi:hypothetical protein
MSTFPDTLFRSLPLLATPTRLAAGPILGRVPKRFARGGYVECSPSGGRVREEVGGGGPKHFSRTTIGVPSRGRRLLRLPMVPKGLLKLMFCGSGRIVASLLGDACGVRLEGWTGAEMTGGPSGFFFRLCHRRSLTRVLTLRDATSCWEAALPTFSLIVTLLSSSTVWKLSLPWASGRPRS